MRSVIDNKKWGTIYLGTDKEATLDSLDAMQAASRQEQWNQRTQNEYMDRVRERATERAREILGAAYTERQSILSDSWAEAQKMQLENQELADQAQQKLAEAEGLRAEAQALRDEAERIRTAAQQEGFDAGLAQARDELDAFRGAMGGSICVVLQAIERQCGPLFEAWREDVVELVKVCVEKGTHWILDKRHADMLHSLVIESVRQLDARRTVNLRVHPDDEAAVADMFAAARELMPDVERWMVTADPDIQLGGLIAESPSSTVDNRVQLRRDLVDNVLTHLTLPAGEADSQALQAVHEVVEAQTAHITSLAPPVPEAQQQAEAEDIAESALPPELSPPPLTAQEPADSPPAPEDSLPESAQASVASSSQRGSQRGPQSGPQNGPQSGSAPRSQGLAPDQSPELAPDFPEALPNGLPDDFSGGFSGGLPDDLPDGFSGGVSDGLPNGFPGGFPEATAPEAQAPVAAAGPQAPPAESLADSHRSSLEALEQELLPLPPLAPLSPLPPLSQEAADTAPQARLDSPDFAPESPATPPPANSPRVDELLASGGFLSDQDDVLAAAGEQP